MKLSDFVGKRAARQNVNHFAGAMRKTVRFVSYDKKESK